MKFRYSLCALLLVLVLPLRSSAEVSEPVFPIVISDKSASVKFSVDSTWHLIEGSVSGINGTIEERIPGDLSSISGSITFPIVAFDTQNSMRDKRMREVMDVAKYPLVEFVVLGTEGECNLVSILNSADKSCEQLLKGTLKIKEVSKEMNIPTTLKLSESGNLNIQGETTFSWREFNIEDPSILVAKLHEMVKVQFNLNISSK